MSYILLLKLTAEKIQEFFTENTEQITIPCFNSVPHSVFLCGKKISYEFSPFVEYNRREDAGVFHKEHRANHYSLF